MSKKTKIPKDRFFYQPIDPAPARIWDEDGPKKMTSLAGGARSVSKSR